MQKDVQITQDDLLRILKDVALTKTAKVGLSEYCIFENCTYGKGQAHTITSSVHSAFCPMILARSILKKNKYVLKEYHILYEKQLGNKFWQAQSDDVLEYDEDDAKVYIQWTNKKENFETRNIIIVSKKEVDVIDV